MDSSEDEPPVDEVDTSPWLPEGKFPEQKLCNPNCPEEAFLFMFSGLPGLKGAPLPFPTEYLRLVSRRIWDCGARPMGSSIPAEQVIKYQRPRTTDPHWLTSPGVWVDQSEPDRDQFDIREFVAGLPQDAKRQLAEALGFDPVATVPIEERQLVDAYEQPRPQRPYPPARDRASVTNKPRPFDPLKHGVTEVLDYLRNADPDEQDRVVAIERNVPDKPRQGILKRYKEVGL